MSSGRQKAAKMEPIGGFGSGGYRMGAFRTLQPALAAKLVDKACRNSEIVWSTSGHASVPSMSFPSNHKRASWVIMNLMRHIWKPAEKLVGEEWDRRDVNGGYIVLIGVLYMRFYATKTYVFA
ncbi:hypothetical protein CPB85DRAFT_1253796 [Mucidula mucida]|nr:hypothetical protein CPB85DRAFT_1253796 [Mucidula mucida]